MNKSEETITTAEAKSTLESLAKIERDTNVSIRPPLWLNLTISFFYGAMTFSWASTRHENLWMLGLIVSAIGFTLALAFYLYTSRLLGIKPKLYPKSKPEFKFQVLLALVFAMVFILTRVFSVSGIWWASYLGGIFNALILAYSLHNYSTGNYNTRKTRSE